MFTSVSHRSSFSLRAVLVYFATASVIASGLLLVGETPARAEACPSGVMPEGTGASATPYLITSRENLIWMSEQTANWSNQHFRQTADIDLLGCLFTPIGDNTGAHFKGTYDGGGFTISRLKIRSAAKSYAGLFGDANETAVFKNIGLLDVDIETNKVAGALIGRLVGSNAQVSNSYSTGNVVGTGSQIGGLVGVLWAGGRISNSYSTASVTAATNNVSGGGLVGGITISGAVTNVYAAGPVRMASGFTSTNIHGLIGGSVQPTVTSAFFDSEVSAASNGIGTGSTTEQMKTAATFSPPWAMVSGWEAFNFTSPTSTWGICSQVNSGYPFLLLQHKEDPCISPPPVVSSPPTSSAPAMSIPSAEVSEVSLGAAPSSNQTLVRVRLNRTPSAFEQFFIVVRLLDLRGELIREVRVPVEPSMSSVEIPVDKQIGQFNVVALTSNAAGATAAISLNPQTVQQSNIRKATETAPRRLTGKSLNRDVVFTADSAALSPQMKRTLRQAARLAKASDSRVAVTGFAAASPKGTKFEKRLAERRALRVANFLRKQGLENWIYFHGVNSRQGSDFAGQPRRVEIRVLK